MFKNDKQFLKLIEVYIILPNLLNLPFLIIILIIFIPIIFQKQYLSIIYICIYYDIIIFIHFKQGKSLLLSIDLLLKIE